MQNLVSLGRMARYTEISKFFPIYGNVKLVTPGRAKFDPRAIIWALLVEAH